jgi:hypothetical protein
LRKLFRRFNGSHGAFLFSFSACRPSAEGTLSTSAPGAGCIAFRPIKIPPPIAGSGFLVGAGKCTQIELFWQGLLKYPRELLPLLAQCRP